MSTRNIIENSRCYLLPTRPQHPFQQVELLNKTFQAWKECWTRVAQKTDFKFNIDDFFRQDAVLSIISPEGEVMGCHLYSFFNTQNQCSIETNYFSKFDDFYKQYLVRHNIYNTMSLEFLTVTKKFRGNRELPLGLAICTLSNKIFEYSNFHALLAQTRDDLNVNKIVINLGGKIISTGFELNGIKGSFGIFEKGKTKPSSNSNVNSFSENTWKHFVDYTNITLSKKSSNLLKRIAA